MLCLGIETSMLSLNTTLQLWVWNETVPQEDILLYQLLCTSFLNHVEIDKFEDHFLDLLCFGLIRLHTSIFKNLQSLFFELRTLPFRVGTLCGFSSLSQSSSIRHDSFCVHFGFKVKRSYSIFYIAVYCVWAYQILLARRYGWSLYSRLLVPQLSIFGLNAYGVYIENFLFLLFLDPTHLDWT